MWTLLFLFLGFLSLLLTFVVFLMFVADQIIWIRRTDKEYTFDFSGLITVSLVAIVPIVNICIFFFVLFDILNALNIDISPSKLITNFIKSFKVQK